MSVLNTDKFKLATALAMTAACGLTAADGEQQECKASV